jgi:DNA-binding response OmpR family regulator
MSSGKTRLIAEARCKILCIDDDRKTVTLLTEELASCAFDVITAYDGHEKFVSILKNMPDLIVCDQPADYVGL